MTLTLAKLRKLFKQVLEAENREPDDELYVIMANKNLKQLTRKIWEARFMELRKKDARAKYKLTVKKGSLPLKPKRQLSSHV